MNRALQLVQLVVSITSAQPKLNRFNLQSSVYMGDSQRAMVMSLLHWRNPQIKSEMRGPCVKNCSLQTKLEYILWFLLSFPPI